MVAQLPVSAFSFPDTRGRPRDTQDGKSKGLEPAVRAVFQNRVPGRKHLNWTVKRLSLGGGIGGRTL